MNGNACIAGYVSPFKFTFPPLSCYFPISPDVFLFQGFQVLIEREWLEFGHRFADRCGHGFDTDDNQRCPVFLQWLDCVHQLTRQYPCSFEFSEAFLVSDLKSCVFMRNQVGRQWSSSSPPTTATRVRSWARTWAEIGSSQSNSEGFSEGSPVFLPPQNSTFPPKSVSSSVLIMNFWRGSLGNHS